MKIWKKYSQYLMSGEWHIHTSYTDGKNSIDEYCKKAVELGIPLVAFTEHVRKDLSYDFNSYLEDIDSAREHYNLIVLSGCETKVLPDCSLDVGYDILEQVDYPIFAFHSFPNDIDKYLDALYTVIKNPYVNAWAHPSMFLKKNILNITKGKLSQIFNWLDENEVLIEINRKHNVPPSEWINLAKSCRMNLVRGSDCHSVEELR
ncbi:DNA polymerase (family 10)/putative hydrolase [Methanomicrobium sp. W14]|uniref:PHP domain-containing protein n=1 Tax=Methanomicrobium sp. W14 TaxID=2817839 RepID=UPI001AEA2977|nr:PHP domain-containing protein [Methanomicrobium sp. W14]MBP2133106.1 DNA polymerase (family 10)/putative hydrolase [Methanomicrobium sp. W14]